MELQNVIDECEINYKVGDQVIYSYLDKEIREGKILKVSLTLDHALDCFKGIVEYAIYRGVKHPLDIITEEDNCMQIINN